MEAATVRRSIHDVVTDLRQRFCRAGNKQREMSLSEGGYGRIETQRDRGSASIGGSTTVTQAFPLRGVSVHSSCPLSDELYPGQEEPPWNSQMRQNLPGPAHVNSELPVEEGATHSPTGSVRVTSFSAV